VSLLIRRSHDCKRYSHFARVNQPTPVNNKPAGIAISGRRRGIDLEWFESVGAAVTEVVLIDAGLVEAAPVVDVLGGTVEGRVVESGVFVVVVVVGGTINDVVVEPPVTDIDVLVVTPRVGEVVDGRVEDVVLVVEVGAVVAVVVMTCVVVVV